MSAPRWTTVLLRWVAPPGRADDVIGDLEEVHGRRVQRSGRSLAAFLTSLDALQVACVLLLMRIRGKSGGSEPGRGVRALGEARISWLDLKLGARMLSKYPGLTVAGGLAIAFAIWVGAATFEFATQVVNPSLPLPDGDRIVGIRMTDAENGRSEPRLAWDFVRLRENLRSVEQLAAFRNLQRNLIVGEGAGEPVEVAEITASGFRVAGVPPFRGRTLVQEDEAPGAPPVVVLGYDVWQSRFGGDPTAVGRTVRLGNLQATVVGIMPEGFGFPVSHNLWTPLRRDGLQHERREGPGLSIFGRLAPGFSLQEAQTELTTLGRQAATAFPDTHERLRPTVLPYARAVLGIPVTVSVAAFLSTNLFLVMLVVLVCGNVALLMFARAASRQSEIVVRTALGASRGRIIGQLFAEALVLGAVAATVGLAAAEYGLRLILAVVQAEVLEGRKLPFWIDASLSPATYFYAAGLTVLAAAVAGVIPALKMTGRNAALHLKETGAGSGGPRFGGVWTAIIVGQVAVTVAFPATGWFMRQSMRQIETFDVGFAEREYLSVRVEMDQVESTGDPQSGSGPMDGQAANPGAEASPSFPDRLGRTIRELEQRLELDPGVAAVTVADRLPRMYHPWKQIEVDEGAVPPPDERGHRVSNAAIAPDYFEVLGTEVVSGRGFDDADTAPEARSVIVNRSFVETVLGGKNPIGRRLRYVAADWWDAEARTAEDWYEIVGVAPDLATTSGYGQAGIYHPLEAGEAHPVHLAIRTLAEPSDFAPRLRELATAVDPTLRLHDPVPMDELDAGELLLYEFWLRLVMIVAAVALLLALTGIYSVTAFTVSRRTREIGLRVALGAPSRRVVAAIFKRPLIQVAGGVALGAVWTFLLASVQAGADGYRGPTSDPTFTLKLMLSVVAYAMIMMAVCMVACLVPTRRALAVEPTEALRAEG